MELEVLVLEDAAGGWVTVGNAEQPVLLTAVATGQLCQESQSGGSSVESAELVKSLDLLRIQQRL